MLSICLARNLIEKQANKQTNEQKKNWQRILHMGDQKLVIGDVIALVIVVIVVAVTLKQKKIEKNIQK